MTGTGKSCPCGSGRPVKECCGGGKVFYSLEQARWRRAGQNLRRGLGEFADQPTFAWDAARAQDLYLGSLDPQLVDQDDDFTMERCFEWFIFDYKLSGGLTVIETFREDYAPTLSEYEGALVREWARSRISLYEVTSVIPNEGLNVRDLLGRKRLRVHDINASTEIEAGSILLMRVLKVGNEYEFSTSGLALPGQCKEPLMKRLQRDRQDYFREKKKEARGWSIYLKDRAHRINAWVMEFGISNQRKKLPERQGHECREILPLENWQKALKALKRSQSFRLIGISKDRAGTFRQVTAALLGQPYAGGSREAGGPQAQGLISEGSYQGPVLCPVIGHLIMTQRFIILTAVSHSLLTECKRLTAEVIEESPFSSRNREAVPNDPAGNLPENYHWLEPGYAKVAVYVREGLESMGYSPKQLKGALKLWFDYCSKERPAIRKAAAWTATVIYAFTRLEMEKELKQQDLAGRYGVASSTISAKFRLLCQSLELVAYDWRYSTKKPPATGFGHNLHF